MIALLLLVAAAPAEQPQWNCEDPIAQQEMNYCAHQEYLAADESLNAHWEETAAVMRARDEAGYGAEDGRPGYFETMLEAQRAWLKYRDAQCRSEGYLFRGGSMEPLMVSTCKTHLTKLRTQELRELIEAGN